MRWYHIRRRRPRARGNQYYRDQSLRDAGTYCGEPETDHDIEWRDKAEPFGEWEPCPKCVAAREAERS